VSETKKRGLDNGVLAAAWGITGVAPREPAEPPAAPDHKPPDYGGGDRGRPPAQAPTMDELLEAAIRGHSDR
jgi:hypothetical protein